MEFSQGGRARSSLLMLGVALCLFLSLNCEAAIHAVDGTVSARYFNEARSAWDKTTISVFYDDQHQVTLMGGHGREKASVRMNHDEFDLLRDALKDGRTRLSRNLDRQDILELFRVIRGSGPYTHGMTVSYWSGNADLAGAIVLFLQDDDNLLSRMELYLDDEEIKALLSQLSRVPH